ncbi:MAG: 50S ribosome-binding GTPase [Ancrocorticia sp.]
MSALTLPEGIETLEHALRIGGSHLPGVAVTEARQLLGKIQQRRERGMDHTVVAFAGATGSGKSSLVNAVTATEAATVSPLRPTTSRALAISSGPVSELLDWLRVDDRVISQTLPGSADSQLVVIDLPDIDSTEFANRDLAERLIARADVVVWVLDPQKYADAVVHEDYLRVLGEHSSSMLIVLNQVDRLSEAERPHVVDNLAEILEADGLRSQVLETSALTGEGVEALRQTIKDVSATKQAAVARLAADLRDQAEALSELVRAEDGRLEAPGELPPFDAVALSLMEASGAKVVSQTAQASYLHRGRRATGWLFTSWMAGRKPDPLAALHLSGESGSGTHTGASSLIPLERQRAVARAGVRRYAQGAAEDLPRGWRKDVVNQSEKRSDALVEAADSLIMNSNVDYSRRPAWWEFMRFIQWFVGVSALGGAGWLLAIWIAGAFQILLPDPPYVGPVGLPTVLLAAGLLLGWLAALLSRLLLGRGARKTANRVSKHLGKGLSAAAQDMVVQPLRADLDNYAAFVRDLEKIRTVR